MTFAIGDQSWEIYQRMFEDMAAAPIHLHYVARELALFVYDDSAGLSGGYMTYKVLPLSGGQ